jgi:ribonuclease HI
MVDQEERKITLLWVLSHEGIPGNKMADQAAKEALDKDIPTTERYPPDDLKKWLTEEDLKKKKKMEKRKQQDERKEDTKGRIISIISAGWGN